MPRLLPLNLLLIFMFILSCQKDGTFEKENEATVNNNSFNEAYSKAKDKSLDNETRLKAANHAYLLAIQEQSDSLLCLALDKKTLLHNKIFETDSAILYSKELLQIVEKNNDSVFIGKTYFKLGLYNNAALVKDSAYYYYHESKKIREALKDSVNVAKTLNNMAILTSNSGSYSESDELAIECLTFLKNSTDEDTKASAINCIAVNGKKQKQYDESLYWYKQAIETTANQKNKNI